MPKHTRPNPQKAVLKALRPVYLTDEAQRERIVCKAPRPWPLWRERGITQDMRERHGPNNPLLRDVTHAYENGYYSVLVRPIQTDEGEACHLMISSLDPFPVRDWHDLMRIKDELVGRDAIAFEVYPAACDVVDGANLTHLWVPAERLAARLSPYSIIFDRPETGGRDA